MSGSNKCHTADYLLKASIVTFARQAVYWRLILNCTSLASTAGVCKIKIMAHTPLWLLIIKGNMAGHNSLPSGSASSGWCYAKTHICFSLKWLRSALKTRRSPAGENIILVVYCLGLDFCTFTYPPPPESNSFCDNAFIWGVNLIQNVTF